MEHKVCALQAKEQCWWRLQDIANRKGGTQALGARSVHELWQQFTVFTMVRNPYDRAGSAYEYLYSRRLVCCCLHMVQLCLGQLVAVYPASHATLIWTESG